MLYLLVNKSLPLLDDTSNDLEAFNIFNETSMMS